MKRILTAALCCVIVCLQLLPCFSAESGMQVERNEDGSFFIISEEPLTSSNPPDIDDSFSQDDGIKPEGSVNPEISGMNALLEMFKKIIETFRQLIALLNNQKSVTKTKFLYYYSADSQLLWSGELTGEFLYSSSSVNCIDASFFFKAYDKNWKLDKYSCTENGNTASVTFSVVQKSLGVNLQTITKTISLTCDTEGNIK